MIGLAVGIFTFFMFYRESKRALAPRTWPIVEGKITSSKVKKISTGEGHYTDAIIEFSYAVGGEVYHSNTYGVKIALLWQEGSGDSFLGCGGGMQKNE